MAVGIRATGAYLPPDVIDNSTIAQWAGTTPEWVADRTGIYERRYAAHGTTTSDLAHAAVVDLLSRLPSALHKPDAIVLATSTPDQPQPATAVELQHLLGAAPAPALDVNAVCAGWLYSLVLAAGLAELPWIGQNILVVGADMYSRIMDRTDRKTVTLFGDGAGAVSLGPVPSGYGIVGTDLAADGEHADLVRVVAGGTKRPLDAAGIATGEHLFRMQGSQVREYVMQMLPPTIHAALDRARAGLDDIDRFVFHQANPNLLLDLAKSLEIDPARVTLTPFYGNTGAASVPITLWETDRSQPIARDELVLLAGVGGGMTRGAVVVRWY